MKSICLRAHEVLGLLDGTVSLIVRPVNPPPPDFWSPKVARLVDGYFNRFGCCRDSDSIRCPFGAPGERLWCKETWANLGGMGFGNEAAYKADARPNSDSDRIRKGYGVKWKSPTHMPRWASRLTIETVSVRVGPVLEIDPQEIVAAGAWQRGHSTDQDFSQAYEAMADRWEADYGKRNPWETSFAWFATVKIIAKCRSGEKPE